MSGSGAGLDPQRIPRCRAPESPAPHRDPLPGGADAMRWERHYVAAVVGNDLVVLVVAVVVGHLLGYGTTVPRLGEVSPLVGIAAAVLVLISLLAFRAWEPRILGKGSEEFSRLIRGFVIGAVAIGLVGLATESLAARPWAFGLIPAAALLAALGRFALRKNLHRLRGLGRCTLPVLAVGDAEALVDLIARTRRDPSQGWVVTGVCTQTGTGTGGTDDVLGVPVVGDLDSVTTAVALGRHRIVAVVPTPGWTPVRLRHLAWNLEDTGAELVVDPGLMEVAGPRLHVQPVDGLPLLRLTKPTFNGVSWLIKHLVDRVGALLLIVLTLPVLVAAAIAVKLDGGPVLFRQQRVGRHGREFAMLKFRSMVVDAESRLTELTDTHDGAGLLFKLREDPRVTRAGRVLRRYSVDELPQLFNVLAGRMSLVGPRPPLPSEVARYERDAARKLLVKPGLTGLWQVSGRSDLSWEESVRLDLRYVENWNLALDALILWKTLGAVTKGAGAY
ncbi:sugar transferase [Pseudonocardia sp. N23]|uniref:sugar transferase n=1 Tax=Pseudonocardia sp. N23 TaxID=1987376 RepID=UPI00209BBFF9|nr:sugar transferase [Pseudonocardia sp. N23]